MTWVTHSEADILPLGCCEELGNLGLRLKGVRIIQQVQGASKALSMVHLS